MKKLFFCSIMIAYIFPSEVFASGAARVVEKGNKLYKDKKYDAALKLYRQVLSKQPDSEIINFDAGTAQYKTNDYQKAVSSFEKSLATEDRNLEAKTNYNLGNSKYMLGLSQEGVDLSAAVSLLEGAVDNYKRTLELAPKDEDAKVNYAIAQKRLKELKEKLKHQPQGNSGSKKQQEQNKEQLEQQPIQAQAKQEEKEAADNQGQTNQAQQHEQQAGQERQGEENLQEQKTLAQPGDSKEMSKEEAYMLLEGYRQEENTAGVLKDDRKGMEEEVSKDW